MKALALATLLLLAAPLPAEPATDPLAPLPEAEWTLEKAAHLLRRAGFGGTPEEIEALHALGLEGAVDRLLDWSGPDERIPPAPITLTSRPAREAFLGKSQEERVRLRREYRQADLRQFAAIREWWIASMILSRHPLRERLVHFWHGHFTSSQRDVRDSYHLWIQHTLFRREAKGNFGRLLHAVSKDPAMLEYLDNNRNRKGRPNENYAREVMELFTLGLGNYTEDDIKEGARALTGWTFQGNRFVFARAQHDDGVKRFLGRRGNFDGDAILDIILEQPATPRYLARKLFRYFAHDNPDEAVVEGLARTLRRADYELEPMLRQLFRSRAFYDRRAIGTHIKSPVELFVQLHRDLGMAPTPGLSFLAQNLGESLLDPPNVKGWPGGRDWITTSHLLNRYNLAGALVGLPQDKLRALRVQGAGRLMRMMRERRVDPNGEEMEGEEMGGGMEAPRRRRGRRGPALPTYDVAAEVQRRGLETPEDIVAHFAGRLLAVPASEEMLQTLRDYLAEEGPRPSPARLHGLLRLIVSTPEFQLS